jgi:hypothetical protein
MKLKSPNSLQSWLFLAGVVALILMGLLSALASILAAHEHAYTTGRSNLGVAATWMALETPISMLEFVALCCLMLAALVSIFRTVLASKPK